GGLAALFMIILAPIAAMLIQLAVTRSREYQADETGAHFTGNPYALASALRKLDAYSRRVPMVATPSTAHLFIIQPLLGMNLGSLFSTIRRSQNGSSASRDGRPSLPNSSCETAPARHSRNHSSRRCGLLSIVKS